MLKQLLIVFVVLALPLSALAQVAPFEGTWEWAQTEYGDGEIVTPVSIGHSEQYSFGPDQDFVQYIDEQVAVEGLWATGEVAIGPCMVEILSANSENWVWSIQEGDTRSLILQTGFECPIGGGTPITKIVTLFSRIPVAIEDNSWGHVKSFYR